MTIAYLLSVLLSLVVLAVAIRPRGGPVPPTPTPTVPAPAAGLPAGAAPELHTITAAAHQLARRLDTAA